MLCKQSVVKGFALLAVLAAITGCAPKEPITIGFLGGITGRAADLGIGGRNGAQLAVEIRNQAGGVGGRSVRLIIEDDGQDSAVAKQAAARLISQGVSAIVGPMTSSMAMATVAQANDARVLMISPTVTTKVLSTLDDYFMRVVSSTGSYAKMSAAYHLDRLGIKRTVAVYDAGNLAYAESWLSDYRQAYEAGGGQLDQIISFRSSAATEFPTLVTEVLKSNPQGVLIIANSVDAALLAQHIRRRDVAVHISASEWASTEELLDLGGPTVEGITVAQFLDRDSTQPAYLAFRKAYIARFGAQPGFPGLTAFDAANVVLDALADRHEGQTVKQAILAKRVFAGAQSPIKFDANGDAERESYMTTIRDGRFVRLR